jgi:Uma2 family endonuclease
MTVEEYLHTSFENPDKEFRDGELVERGCPDTAHGLAQALLGAFFESARRTHQLFPCFSVRLCICREIYLVPDVAVFYPDEPVVPFPDSPPFLVAEVLSPEECFGRVRDKLEEYRNWGVKHVWLVDPHSKRMYTCDPLLTEVSTLRIPELGLEVTPADVFES